MSLTAHPDAYFGTPNRPNVEKETMEAEKKRCSFPIRSMTYVFDGSEEETRYRELANTIIQRDHVLMKTRFYDLEPSQERAKSMEQICRFVEVTNSIKDPKLRTAFKSQMSRYDRNFGMRLYVHGILFRETIWAQGTKEQFQKWEYDIDHLRVLGCFALTELGHSSFIRGSETYAIYDKENQEFVINSGSLLATKWWIGMAGEAATHTVCIANLVIDGKVLGLHWFIVPLRDRLDGHLVPGVAAGYVGPRAGRPGLDNGWIQFTHLRVPRENMLSRWASVSPEGVYTPAANQAVSYGTLIGERIAVLDEILSIMTQASTIAVRYAAVRRQGENDEQVLDYQAQQRNLLPVVAGVYAVRFLGMELITSWTSTQHRFDQTNNQDEYLSKISDYHGISAGIKTWMGWWTMDALEVCRRALGGHAYSQYNAISGLIGDFSVVTTGGGDNYVLAQQCARYLLSSLMRAQKGKKLGESVRYFADAPSILARKHLSIKSAADLRQSSIQLAALSWLSITVLATVGEALQAAMSSGQGPSQAWNSLQTELIASTRPYTMLYILSNFVAKVESLKSNKEVYPVLKKLCDLFALTAMQQLGEAFLENSYMTPADLKAVRQEVLQLCLELRGDAIGLVSAFNLPDWILKAPLGREDGDIYNAYFGTVSSNPGSQDVPAYFNALVKPLTSGKAKL